MTSKVVGKNLVVRSGVAFGSGNAGLQPNYRPKNKDFESPEKGVGWKRIFHLQGKMIFSSSMLVFFFAGKRCDTITSFSFEVALHFR